MELAVKAHERICIGLKPCEYEDSGKAFIVNGELIQHETIHNLQEAYVCKEGGQVSV